MKVRRTGAMYARCGSSMFAEREVATKQMRRLTISMTSPHRSFMDMSSLGGHRALRTPPAVSPLQAVMLASHWLRARGHVVGGRAVEGYAVRNDHAGAG